MFCSLSRMYMNIFWSVASLFFGRAPPMPTANPVWSGGCETGRTECCTWRKTKVVLVKVVSWIIYYLYIRIYTCVTKLMVCVYKLYIIQENNRLFRKPPLLGPPLSLPDIRWLRENPGWESQAETHTHQQEKSFGVFRKCAKTVVAQGGSRRQRLRDEDLSIAGMAE